MCGCPDPSAGRDEGANTLSPKVKDEIYLVEGAFEVPPLKRGVGGFEI
jgi:hypothetical protein